MLNFNCVVSIFCLTVFLGCSTRPIDVSNKLYSVGKGLSCKSPSFSEFLESAGLAPVETIDGSISGFRIVSLQSGGAFDLKGLKKEDLLINFNGNKIISDPFFWKKWLSKFAM